jgi:hypothetical protein
MLSKDLSAASPFQPLSGLVHRIRDEVCAAPSTGPVGEPSVLSLPDNYTNELTIFPRRWSGRGCPTPLPVGRARSWAENVARGQAHILGLTAALAGKERCLKRLAKESGLVVRCHEPIIPADAHAGECVLVGWLASAYSVST